MRSVLVALLLAVAVQAADPPACKWSWKSFGCLPKDSCRIKPRLGSWCVATTGEPAKAAPAAGRPRRWEHALKDELNFAQNPSLRAQQRVRAQHPQKTRSKDSMMHSKAGKGAGKGAGSRQGSGKSQGGQEARLHQIFATVGVLNKSYVEFGYQGRSTSNTFALWKDGWNGLLLDGDPKWASKSDGGETNLHRAKVTSRSIVRLFRRYDVPLEVDYVSIDIDSFDLWVLRALLGSEYRPRVLTVEYNSNFPWDAGQLAFPDPEVMRVPPRMQQWGGNCYMGSSAAALHAVAREHRYSVPRPDPRPQPQPQPRPRPDPDLDPTPTRTFDPRPSILDPRPSTLDARSSVGG